jgi:hypothetical protein
MADYPYTSNPARVKEFLQKIHKVGNPDKVTFKFLESLGFKSKNDRAILPVLKSLGFVDGTGIPTQRWKDYRSTAKAKSVMAAAVRSTYSSLRSTTQLLQLAHRRRRRRTEIYGLNVQDSVRTGRLRR